MESKAVFFFFVSQLLLWWLFSPVQELVMPGFPAAPTLILDSDEEDVVILSERPAPPWLEDLKKNCVAELAGGFKDCLFSTLLGEIIQFD